MRTEPRTGERVLVGLPVAPGIAIGPAHLSERGGMEVPEYRLDPGAVDEEIRRFRGAVAKARRQIRRLKEKSAALPPAAAEEMGYLLDAHLHMLEDSRLVRGAEARIGAERLNAEAAVQKEIHRVAGEFLASGDAFLSARAEDIREVGERLTRSLTNTPYKAFSFLPKGCVLLADELSPADTALLDPARVAAFAAQSGGMESHTAIMARSLGLPAVLGVPSLLSEVANGDIVIVDGAGGRIIVQPSARTLEEYQERRAAFLRERRQLARLRDVPAVTLDGTQVALRANMELPVEVEAVRQSGAAGVGLLRTEFMFMNRRDLPDEEEQFQALATIVEALEGEPVTIRTLDIGGDKIADALSALRGHGQNPALGLRAIRLSLKEPKLLETQLAAILRAGAIGPVRILLPMVTTVGEVKRVRELLQTVVRRLRRRRLPMADPLPPLGVMIEVPGAALTADALARACDFFAIGTNDLTMYTLAIDRGDDQVAHLYNPLHPAVLRLIQFTTEAAHRARIPVSVCGEMAGDPRCTALLLGLGIRDLSMAAGSVLRVKQRVRQLDGVGAANRAHLIMDQWDSGRIAALLDDFNSLA